jgi:hypothetical protein
MRDRVLSQIEKVGQPVTLEQPERRALNARIIGGTDSREADINELTLARFSDYRIL